MRPPISSADLLCAFRDLKPATHEQKIAIANVLGLDWKPPLTPLAAPPLKDEVRVPDTAPKSAPIPSRPVPPRESAPVVHAGSGVAGFTISGPKKQDTGSTLWATAPADFESPAAAAIPVDVAPLFVPRWTRGIVSTALATRSPAGPPDIRKVVSEIALGRLLRSLPRLYVAAMALRVEVLVDVGDSMLPFAEDQRSVIADVRTVAGFDNVAVLKFTGSPLRAAGTDEMDVWPDYVFPSSRTHVLLLTDVGIGRPPLTDTHAGVEEWRSFSWELRRRGIACTAFVPYPAKRWPPALARQFRMVEWDRATTAGNVRFARRPERA
ncbi:MAG TPA: hypothetical protein VIX89_12225 [Bryobacteraceae bacterium]